MKKRNGLIVGLSVAIAVVALVCSVVLKITPTSDNSVSAAKYDKASFSTLAGYYSQKPLWSNCPGENKKARCAGIIVPLDWSNVGANQIKIAVAVNPATDPTNAPYLLMNPGGPGGSGKEWITKYISSLGTSKLRSAYNLVGFDPRGVGDSTPIKCTGSPSALRDFLYNASPFELGSKKDINYSKTLIKFFGQACLTYTGSLLGHVDTSSAAKDMDILRAVLGSKKLNYLGYSYGTLLGITYASFFPKKVGKFVLDGVVDPTVSPTQDSLNQLTGFQSAMRAYLADCISNVSGCPFAGLTVDQAMTKIGNEFLKPLETTAMYTSEKNRTLTINSGFTGILAALYSKDSWQYLTKAFQDVIGKAKPDGRIFLLLADSYYGYDDSTKTFGSNENEAFKAISCLDSRESDSEASMLQQNARVLAISPVFGRYWQYGGLGCYKWPFAVVPGPKDYSAKSAPTILVVGTTNDPATPYSQAQNVAHNVLAHGWLLTYQGEGHTAYGSSNQCVADTVENFLSNGKLPAKEKTC
jgi:pimeloyl-ACP methyl ester carboxylesterase